MPQKKKQSIIEVHLKKPRPGREKFYFFSKVSRIFECLDYSEIGVTLSRLYQCKVSKGQPYENKKVSIRTFYVEC